MDLNASLVLVRVIQCGSFTKAARLLEMPISTVSLKVAQLERSLGVSLLRRTTRKLQLTPAGEVYFQSAAKALEALDEAAALTREAQAEVQGRLRMTAPVEIGMSRLAEVVGQYTAKNPKVHVELLLTDRRVDLIGERVDLALRMGDLKDSGLISRKIGASGFSLYASPKYLKSKGEPKIPCDLAEHRCLSFTNLPNPGEWHLKKGDSTQRVRVNGPLSANNLVALQRMTVEGHGVAMLPSFLCEASQSRGELRQVLPGWGSKTTNVSLVYPAQRFVSRALRELINHIIQNLQHVF